MTDEKVVEWLRSPAGTLWSRETHQSAIRHQHGVFAEEKWDIEHCTSVFGYGDMCPCNSRVPHFPDYNTMQIAGEISTGIIFEDDEQFDIVDRGNEWLRQTYKNPDMLDGFGPDRRLNP